MSRKVHLKLCLAVPVECLIAEWRYKIKDFRLIDSGGNSIMFHKTILQNISLKFDYLNKFCGEVSDGFEQMRLQTIGHYALQVLHDLVYVGPAVFDEKCAAELCDQLQVLQLPLVTETRLESLINYNRVELNSGEKSHHLQFTRLMQSTANNVLTRRMILPAGMVKGKESALPSEIYQRNHLWTEGLISAAKEVACAAKLLVEAADKVIAGKAKLEELVIASNKIAAATAQLVVAFRLKTGSKNVKVSKLIQSSKEIREATGDIAIVKSCTEKNDTMNLAKPNLLQVKKMEMESLVRLIELESELTREKVRFAGLRKKHYHLVS